MKKGVIVVFILGFFGILLFYFWSSIAWISLILLVSLDYITLKWFRARIASLFPQKFKPLFKYGFYICLLIGFAIFIRTFIIDIYYVPSSSMERTLFPGDYVLVNKLSYGVKIPQNIGDIPVIGTFFKGKKLGPKPKIFRPLEGFRSYKREDIVVFNSVSDNDKLLIKRIIGLPGERLSIKDTQIYINDNPLKELPNYTFNYKDSTKVNLYQTLNYSNAEKDTLNNKYYLTRIIDEKQVAGNKLFRYSGETDWTKDNFGPILIPKKGLIIQLTAENIEIYGSILVNFENEKLLTKQIGKIYQFKHDYYFMMGDNRDFSQDSRFFGFIPASFIQGKMTTIL